MKDALFFHRTDYAQKLLNSLKDGITHAVTLFAPRRMGKTQFLLQDIAPLAEQQGFNVFYFSFMDSHHPISDFQSALYQFAQNIQAGNKAKTFLSGISKIDILGIGLEREIASNEAPRLSDIIAVIASDNRPSLLLLDEVQELARLSDAKGLIRSLRTGLDVHQYQIKTIFTGSSTNGLRAMFNDNKAPFFHFAHALDFPLLGQEFTDFLAEIYYERTGKPINTAALFELFQSLHHTPMYLRAIIQDMIINPSISLREAAEKRMAQLGEQDREAGQWQQMKALEKAIIRDIAKGIEVNLYSQENRQKYAALLGVGHVGNSSVQGAIRRMERHDWISRDAGGKWIVNNPLLATWIRENSASCADCADCDSLLTSK
ncbi:ATP-binding protein [Suttonella indologenes]|nr:ATP-binding protein [Suttonella indologenes]